MFNPHKIYSLAASAIFSLAALLLSALIHNTASAENPTLQEVAFVPQWVPQAQFAGYYVAYEKGIYQQAGLKVKVLPGGPEFPPSQMLDKNAAQFGTFFLSSVLQQRARGRKLVNVAQIVQRSSHVLIAKRASNIFHPEDINGKKVGLWGPEFQVQPRAFFRKYGIEPNIIPQSVSVNLFMRGGTDVASAMWHNEYHTILNSGLNPDELTLFFFDAHGLNFPEDGIYCLEDTFLKMPELACRFARASIEGWKYAFAHQEEALDIVMRYIEEAKVATNRVHQRWMFERMHDIIDPDRTGKSVGVLRENDYDRVGKELKASGFIDQFPAFSEIYRPCVSE